MRWVRPMSAALLLLASALAAGCAPRNDFDYNLRGIVRPHLFSFVTWEYSALRHEIAQLGTRRLPEDEEVGIVLDYFAAGREMESLEARIPRLGRDEAATLRARLDELRQKRLALRSTVERILERQVRDAFASQGIFNPLDRYIGLGLTFPPMNFRLEKPPHLLVVSLRERIETIREVTLQPDLELDEIVAIESSTDELGVSSLVVELGGLGATYPAFVSDNASLRFTLSTVAEEWLHQYLAFRPLGFLYLLHLAGIQRDREIATLNETVASMVSEEIGALVYDRYYRPHQASPDDDGPSQPEFDFDAEMREIRRRVDAYLERGDIERAEEFMEERRQYLASKGFYIRKLNQAYFAFHGTYGDDPASVSPIGPELRALRARSASVKDFLDTAAALTSRDDLVSLIAP